MINTVHTLNNTETSSVFKGKKICMVGPFPPRVGGVTVQTALLVNYLEKEGTQIFRVDSNLQKLRVPIIGAPIRLVVQPWVVALRLLRTILNCDLVHIQAAAGWGFMPAVIAVPIAKLFRKRSLITFHSGAGPQFVDRYPGLVKWVYSHSTDSTVCSRELQEAFAQRGLKSHLIYNLFNSEVFQFRERPSVSPKLVWPRTMYEAYEPLVALKTYEYVKERYPDATLAMTGSGNLLPVVQRYIADHNLSGVTLLGRLPSDGVARTMYDAEICINTSKRDGLPTALLEAAASGLPIVTTSAGGIASLFKHGVTAIMTEIGDAKGLADGISYLLENPDKAREMGCKARDTAEKCSWPYVSKDLARVYRFGLGS